MAFIVVYDANAMYGNTVRDLMIRLGRAPETIDDVLGQLERAGLVESAAALRTN